ncbi:hypothetical protein RHGRI_031128 [Rhododendron griersonianum]|uniref:Uncharacterized protein n=1 Tax=Rhododendron griersonianum TaxID=479676 RepID=A0AAV6I9A4_9ERIC|nr:hypothetical protein RHGRI_031128 [Rhododendron griersonianum]
MYKWRELRSCGLASLWRLRFCALHSIRCCLYLVWFASGSFLPPSTLPVGADLASLGLTVYLLFFNFSSMKMLPFVLVTSTPDSSFPRSNSGFWRIIFLVLVCEFGAGSPVCIQCPCSKSGL